MKVQVKGLVFAGFAAMVFATNANATADDAKTVTSKLYVDNYAQEQAKRVTIGNETGDRYATYENIPAATWSSNTDYPSMKVLNEVKNAVNNISVTGDSAYIDVTTTNGASAISLDTNNLAKTEASITDTTTATVTDGVTTVPAAQDKLVTASAVKNYAQPKVPDNNTGKIMFGRQTSSTSGSQTTYTNGWGELVIGDAATALSTPKYVAKKETSSGSGVYDIGLDSATVVTGRADITTGGTIVAEGGVTAAQVTAAQTKLTTAKAVYDFVDNTKLTAGNTTGGTISSNTTDDSKVPTVKNVYQFVTTYGANNYHPVITADANNTNKVMVGYRSYDSATTTYGDSVWKTLVGDNYINVGLDANDNPIVTFNAASQETEYSGTITGSSGFAATTAANQTVPTSANVFKFVAEQLGGLTIPEPGEDCSAGANGITDSNGVACALVLAYFPAETGGPGAGVRLKWIPMAQPSA